MSDILSLYANQLLAWIGMVMAVLALVVWLAWAFRRRTNGHWIYGIPAITLAGNYLGFYLSWILDRIEVITVSDQAFRLWTSFSWSFTMTLLFGLGVVVYFERLHFGLRGGNRE